ncbi:PAS domain-containing hybrid sensor histidine kinase/response regulator [Megalodesulfovibrio gigas]|nr:ATP-binding protein [Megalodesulfovibrio gigas]
MTPSARMDALVDHLPLSIMVFDAQGRLEFVNRWHLDVFNQGKLPASFFLGLTMQELPGLKSAGVAEDLSVVFEGKRVFMDEVRVPRYASGRSGYQRIRCLPMFADDAGTGQDDNRVCGAVLIREDITAHMLGKQRLQEAETKYRTIFQSAPVGIFLTTLDGRFLDMNQTMAAMLGYESPRDAIHAISDIAAECYATPADRTSMVEELRRTGIILGLERDFKRRDGSLFTATLHAHFVNGEDGAPLHMEGMLTDTTARRQAEEALREAKLTAELANAAKSAFLANISHDLRTPLHHMLGMAELAAAEAVSPTQLEYLRLQRQAGEHLLSLVNDLLDLSLIEADKLELASTPFSLRALAGELQALFARQAEEKGLEFSVAVEPGLPDARQGDPTRLRQVLVNLAGNALKFTAQGYVRVEFLAHPLAEEVHFQVRDTGPGIPRRRQQDIFEPYTRLQARDSVGGAGLGLAISRRLVERMGGSLSLVSTPGRGARFFFSVPLPAAITAASPQLAAPAPLQELPGALPRRVLVVEDEPVSRLYSLKVLEQAGIAADAVTDGETALERLAATPYDAVLLDMHLRDMDGLTLLHALRAFPENTATPPATPVLMVTAQAMRGDRSRILAAGADAYLAKPVNSAQLLHALARLHVQPLPPGDNSPRT